MHVIIRVVVTIPLLAICIIPIQPLRSQALSFEQKHEIISTYTDQVRRDTERLLYRPYEYLNGKLHNHIINKNNHPYLGDNQWQSGKLMYIGETFDTELLKYDLESDHLIVLPYNTRDAYPIAINRHELKGFTFNDRRFIHSDRIDLPIFSIAPGYVEVLYDGDTKFYLKRKKTESLNNSARQIEYRQQIKMILYKDGNYYRIRNRLGLLYRLRDNWKEVRRYVHEQGLRLYKYEYADAEKILEFYDNL